MIIQSSSLNMRSAYLRESRQTTEVTVRTWDGSARPTPTRPAPDVGANGANGANGPEGATADHRVAGRLATLIALVERMTGERVHVMDPDDLRGSRGGRGGPGAGGPAVGGAAAAGGRGAEITVTSTSVEREGAAVAVAGSVLTADGRQIDVAVDLQLYREAARSTRVQLRTGAPEPKDPLVLSFGVTPALTSVRAELDLDGDGATEAMPLIGEGLAYLALDRNGDGAVSDGSELFGPATGNGFAELAAYDQDGNGWIDEADPVFSGLRLWSGPGEGLHTLGERGVGAIGLANVDSRYRLQAGGETLGELRATGVWLGEDGSVGTVHQVDVVT